MNSGNRSQGHAVILDDTSNAAVVHLSGRRFPGIVIQGDTLKTLHDDVVEAMTALHTPDAGDVLGAAERKLADLVSHYEAVLSSRSIELPYVKAR
ncbi:MAG TPA: hypothetical protein VLW85_14555 [Myxococcales bacterium]|nr:hypothetical protein [Myxococcales bacterium]